MQKYLAELPKAIALYEKFRPEIPLGKKELGAPASTLDGKVQVAKIKNFASKVFGWKKGREKQW